MPMSPSGRNRRAPLTTATHWRSGPLTGAVLSGRDGMACQSQARARHLKSTLIWTGVHVDEAVMGLSVHTDEDGGGDNPLLHTIDGTI